MADLHCPNCSAVMERRDDPDIVYHACPSCGGVLLERGEVNVLATGMAGDIEYCSLGEHEHEDRFPRRICPRDGSVMEKAELLGHTGVMFDHCPECGAFFLDGGEVTRMNETLAHLVSRAAQGEFRGEIDGYFVRKDRLGGVAIPFTIGGEAVATRPATYVRLAVYLRRPLDIGARITPERWTDRLLRRLGLGHRTDVESGIRTLDDRYLIEARDVDGMRALLSYEPLVRSLVELADRPPRLFSFGARLEVLDTVVMCTGGPFAERRAYDVHADPEGTLGRLIDLARRIDERAG